jgi:predicted nuclease of predicted toxin-antitoxin system
MFQVDAQVSPAIASWIEENFGLECRPLRDVGLRDATDLQIFHKAREQGAMVMTKGADFVLIQGQKGPPPQIIWLSCGNTSKARLREILSQALPRAMELLRRGEDLVEIR